MGTCCDLEVDVNGEEIFLVNKKIVTTFSGKFDHMFSKLRGKAKQLKVIFHAFPGGAEGFELILRYCYNYGKIEINSTNIFCLYCAENFLEMKKNNCLVPNLTDRMEKYLEEIPFWTWSQLLSSLKQCQDLYAAIDSKFLEKYLAFFVGRLYTLNVASSYPCYSSEISTSQISSDFSSGNIKRYSYQTTWWFEDLSFLNINLFEKLVQVMNLQGFDHTVIFKLIICYRRCKFVAIPTSKKIKILEGVINLISTLDKSSISRKGLMEIFRVTTCWKINVMCKKKIENLVGSKFDDATIDDLLVPSPQKKKCMYDVNMILRLLRIFSEENIFSLRQLKKIGSLMDLYLVEVAPDPHLRPYKFVKLLTAVKNFTRDSHDKIYVAIDIYLKVHCNLSEEQKMKICSIMNIWG